MTSVAVTSASAAFGAIVMPIGQVKGAPSSETISTLKRGLASPSPVSSGQMTPTEENIS